MHPLPARRSRHSGAASSHAKNWPADRVARRHPHASRALFYLALFTTESSLLGYACWSGPDIWPTWSIASIVFATLFFALIASNHHFSKASKPVAADLLLAAICMLLLVALTIVATLSSSGPALLAYAWLCALLVNTLHYYPGRSWSTKKRR